MTIVVIICIRDSRIGGPFHHSREVVVDWKITKHQTCLKIDLPMKTMQMPDPIGIFPDTKIRYIDFI